MTSAQVVAGVKRLLPKKTRIGHTGTLDPLASGLLVLMIGRATRLSRYVMDLDKTYVATARFGATSTTLDAEGEISTLDAPFPNEPRMRDALSEFTGCIEQIPPMASALKVGGERLYKLHRRGETVERNSRRVTIRALDLTSLDIERAIATFEVRCSSGTYVRTLISDLANRLETGAYLTGLRRTAVGHLHLENASTPDELSSIDLNNRIIQPSKLLRAMPVLEVDEDARRDVSHGRGIPGSGMEGSFRVESAGELLAVYRESESKGEARPEVVLWAK